MRSIRRAFVTVLALASLLLLGLPASGGHDDDPSTEYLHPLGHMEEPASLLNPETAGDT